jgi:pimeloyl-ACP methyl ester carboxylesterase
MTRLAPLSRFFDGLGLILGVCAVSALLYYWDPTRVVIKRLAPGADARFERVPADLATLPVSDWLTVRGAGAVRERRARLTARIFGTPDLPFGLMPQRVIRDVEKNAGPHHTCVSQTGPSIVHLLSRMDTIIMRALACEAAYYRDWKNLAGIDELTGYLSKDWRPFSIAYFRPESPNNRLILYQQGLAATYHDQHRMIEELLAKGFTVAAMNMPGYGDNTCYDWRRYCDGQLMDRRFATDLSAAFLPPVIAVNYALAQQPFTQISMIGVSSGAWVTLVSAAIDPRIDASFPVAGVLPLALLIGKEESARTIVEGLTDIAGVLDLAVMGADRPGRRQAQIFNRFDRCCFYGPRPGLYADLIADAARDLSGRLQVVFDETHARHKISRWAVKRILETIVGDRKVLP